MVHYLQTGYVTRLPGKLKLNNDNEMMMKEISVEGILSIQAGENPRVIEEKLKSFLGTFGSVIQRRKARLEVKNSEKKA